MLEQSKPGHYETSTKFDRWRGVTWAGVGVGGPGGKGEGLSRGPWRRGKTTVEGNRLDIPSKHFGIEAWTWGGGGGGWGVGERRWVGGGGERGGAVRGWSY